MNSLRSIFPLISRSSIPTVYSRALPRSRFFSTNSEQELSPGELQIYQKLTEHFAPSRLMVQDISGGCGSMYAVEIVSDKFEGMSMVRQHRMVNEVLKEEIGGMHGIRLQTSAK
ncbi:uncharacterized protein VTP21DRAFT_5768 [Calcarisporiella thermophila]|uniref:uncharacterized protein n=1 Tax=Calcarisporiella thermophila TaxID=911321 RepID=UPI0037420779